MTALPPWHAAAWQALQQRLQHGAMPHALLLAGESGLGKHAFLDALVQRLLCLAPQDGFACGTCQACHLLHAGTHPDVIRVELELNKSKQLRKEIVIDQIRALRQRLSLSSQQGGWQVAVIDPADRMNTAAANALLKTLEEPTPSSMLILLCEAPWRLPATIHSRCQRIDLHVPQPAQARAWLEAQGVHEVAEALDIAGGNPGLAQAWAESGAIADYAQIKQELLMLMTGNTTSQQIVQRWTGDEHVLLRLRFAATVIARELRTRATGHAGEFPAQLGDRQLAAWFRRFNQARQLAYGPLRQDLLLLDVLSPRRAEQAL